MLRKMFVRFNYWLAYFVTTTASIAALAELLLRSFLVIQSTFWAIFLPTVWPWILVVGAFVGSCLYFKYTYPYLSGDDANAVKQANKKKSK